MNKQAFILGFQKAAKFSWLDIIKPMVGAGIGGGIGALVNPSDRGMGALIGAGAGAGLNTMNQDWGNWNALIGTGLGAGLGYLPNRSLQDAAVGGALGLASSIPTLSIYDTKNKLNESGNRLLTSGILSPLLGAALGGYINQKDRLQGAMVGGGIGLGMGIPSIAIGSLAKELKDIDTATATD